MSTGAAAISELSPTVVHQSKGTQEWGANDKRPQDHLTESFFIKSGLLLCMTLFPTLLLQYQSTGKEVAAAGMYTQDVGRVSRQ